MGPDRKTLSDFFGAGLLGEQKINKGYSSCKEGSGVIKERESNPIYGYISTVYGPIVYRLGHILLKDGSGVRFPVGS